MDHYTPLMVLHDIVSILLLCLISSLVFFGIGM